MNRPIINKELVAQAKSIYEQKLATYVIQQYKFIDQLQDELENIRQIEKPLIEELLRCKLEINLLNKDYTAEVKSHNDTKNIDYAIEFADWADEKLVSHQLVRINNNNEKWFYNHTPEEKPNKQQWIAYTTNQLYSIFDLYINGR